MVEVGGINININMNNEYEKFLFILSESERIEKSNEFITTKVMKLLLIRGHIVKNSFTVVCDKDGGRLEEYIIVDNKHYVVFYHNTQEFYYMNEKGERFLMPSKTPMDVVRYLKYICL